MNETLNEKPPQEAAPVGIPASPTLPAGHEPAQRQRRGYVWASLLASVTLSLCLTAAALYLYDQKFAQKLVVLDMTAFLNEQRALLMAGKTEESEKKFDELEAKLNNLPTNQVVLLKSVAVRNAIEIKP